MRGKLFPRVVGGTLRRVPRGDEAVSSVQCGLIRRDSSGRWWYGDRQIGVDGEMFDGALEDAIVELSDAPQPTVHSQRRQAQLALSFPPEEGDGLIGVDANMTLQEARAQFWPHIDSSGGAFCLCCERVGRRYARRFHAEMATFLIRLVKLGGEKRAWLHMREVMPGGDVAAKISSDGSYLTRWGLVQRNPSRHGVYRATQAGVAFVRGQITVPRIVYIYDGNRRGESKHKVTIHDALDEDVDVESMLNDTAGPGSD